MISHFYTYSVRHRPTTLMFTSRSKKAVFKSKLQQQQRRPNLSCSPNTVQCLAHIWSSRSPNDLYFFFLKSGVNFLQLSCLPEDLVRMLVFLFYSDKKIKIFTKSKVGTHSTISHQINNSEFWPIKGGICHVFGGLVVQIKLVAT